MKKVIFLFVIAAFSICRAQDTVQYGDPQYLFNERVYYEAPYAACFPWTEMCCRSNWIDEDFVVRYHTETPERAMLIYGVALTIDTHGVNIDKFDFEVNLAVRDSNGGLTFIDSTRWKESDARAYFTYSIPGGGQWYEKTVPSFELYFDTPRMVYDTFFVGYRYTRLNPPIDFAGNYVSYDSSETFYIYSAHNPSLDIHSVDWIPIISEYWGSVFPIIQPNRHCAMQTKPRPIVYNATNTVRIELPYAEGDSLLLNIVAAGQPVDSGMFYDVTDNELTLVMPDSGSYEARLCRFCRRNDGTVLQSAWSDAATIFITHSLGIRQADGTGLSVSPNPATDKVTVDCTVADGTLTLLDMCGRIVAEVPSSQRIINIENLPAEAYILRLSSPTIIPIAYKLVIE